MAKKWLVLLAAVVALGGTAACGSDDDSSGSGSNNGGTGGGNPGNEECADLISECIDGGEISGTTGPCAEEWDAYVGCADQSCFEENEPVFISCVEDNCPETLPCFEE